MSMLKKLFDSNEREIRKLRPLVSRVLDLEPEVKRFSDQELSVSTQRFKERISRGEQPDNLLPEAFAVVRETARRVLDMRHFDVQILGGIVLHQGRIAEMQTGEGKTLVATLPAYLNAVSGMKVHVVTVNDYLARRDREWMGQIYRFLGLDVGLVIPGMDVGAKKKSYACPIIYGTNTEFGFDYLRDNMALTKDDLVQSELDYAIIDEVDSILIDEARTPLIISGQGEGNTAIYRKFRDLAQVLIKDVHYTVDEKARIVALTEEGVKKAEKWLGTDNLYSQENMDLSHYLIQALRAKELMRRDVDYVVKDGEVLIVDEFTGRILVGRRYSDGLHQAIEAKEGVEIRQENDILATITVQNFFRMYKKLAGMTGTAATEESEFMEIYGLDVVVVPTNKPLIRTALPDSIWKTEAAKLRAVVEEICELHNTGRPVLVGTVSVEKSERLSSMLAKRKVPHQVLNAKYHEKEAEIVAQAGRKGAVTIATNMAGRGTDILLGGNPAFLAKRALRDLGYEEIVVSLASEKVLPEDLSEHAPAGKEDEFRTRLLEARDKYWELYEDARKVTDAEHEEVVKLGGLHVIGTERHEARRIDNQLRGRAGRQGDPGSSQFFLSLEDDLMRLFGGDLISSIMDKVGFTENEPIEHPLVTKSVETAQKRIEAHNFAIRKRVLEYDNVLNKQREVMYRERREILVTDDPVSIIKNMIAKVVTRYVNLYWPQGVSKTEADLGALAVKVSDILPSATGSLSQVNTREELTERLQREFYAALDAKARELGVYFSEFVRVIMLRVVDQKWVDHLRLMDDLREGIGLRAYGQRDPLLEYQKEGFELFQGLVQNIEEDSVRYVLRVTLAKPASEAPGDKVQRPAAGPSRSKKVKIGRNDPCPCGSGKKYKHCCGRLT